MRENVAPMSPHGVMDAVFRENVAPTSPLGVTDMAFQGSAVATATPARVVPAVREGVVAVPSGMAGTTSPTAIGLWEWLAVRF